MPLTPDTSTPASRPSHLIAIDLVMVTAPKPPGSRQLILPPAAVLEIAPAKVLHGAVRLHGLASSPTPETQVRVACACAGAVASAGTRMAPAMAIFSRCLVIFRLPFGRGCTPKLIPKFPPTPETIQAKHEKHNNRAVSVAMRMYRGCIARVSCVGAT